MYTIRKYLICEGPGEIMEAYNLLQFHIFLPARVLAVLIVTKPCFK